MNVGVERVKEAKIQTLKREFEMLMMRGGRICRRLRCKAHQVSSAHAEFGREDC